MSRSTSHHNAMPPGSRDLLDAYFDGELDSAGKGRLHEALRTDAVLAEEFSRTSEAVSMLRQSASNTGLRTDLSESVLARCDVRQRYINKRGRRFVLAGRSAVALASLAIVGGIVAWVRMTPPQFRLAEHERPLGVLIEGGNADAAGLRLVPPAVQKDLSDSVDQSKANRTIVFHLQPDPAHSFSMGQGLPAAQYDARAMAQLPLLARSDDAQAHRAAAARLGPLPMASQRSASVVRGEAQPLSGDAYAGVARGWWGRDASPLRPRHRIIHLSNGQSLLLLGEAKNDEARSAEPDRERE